MKLIMLACCAALLAFGTQAAPRIPKAGVAQASEENEYLSQVDLRSESGISEETLSSFAGIDVTGSLSLPVGETDGETTRLMKHPKCGVVDKVDRSTGGRSKRWSPLGGVWNKSNLTYRITEYSDQLLDNEDVDQVIAKAFDVWTKYVDLRIAPAPTSEEADIVIKFVRERHGDGNPFDGDGGYLAHAYGPGEGLGGDIHFDDDDDWDLEKLYHVAVHEIGHALGLGHTNVEKSAMLESYPFNAVETLSEDDITGIQARYGKKIKEEEPDLCKDFRIDAILDSADGHVYAFKGKHYWKLTKNGIAAGYPKLIATKWRELPGDIDAAFTYNRKTYFFKGSWYWKYLGDKMTQDQRRIGEGFPGIPDDVDTAMLWSRDRLIYFFKGSKYWRYEPRQKVHVESDYPRPISDWRGLPRKVDAALSFIGNSYFFKGEYVYRFNDATSSVDSKGLLKTRLNLFGCH